MTVILLKAAHISALLIWAAGLFYLPGLYAAHPGTAPGRPMRRLRALSRFSYIYVVSPAGIIAIITGTALIALVDPTGGWLPLKLTLVAGLVLFHIYCGHVLGQLHENPALRSARVHLLALVPPGLLVPGILFMVLAKPV